MSNDLHCPICGKPTRVYMGNARKDRLCGTHADMLKAGEILLCETCGKYHPASVPCECQKSTAKERKETTHHNNEPNCIICGEPSNGKPQCKNCFHQTRIFIDNLNKNKTIRELRDHYYNLKERILIIRDIENAKEQCNKLIAIAMINQNQNDDTSLMDRVYKDIDSLLKSKKPINTANQEINEKQKELDEQKIKIYTSQDGHNLKSEMEVKIDDVLYNLFMLHCYEKSIDEITEKRKKCDWFIPIANGEGIYIEYWGMETQKYIKERKEKEELYKKYDIPYIGIEKDDPKGDTQTFKSNLNREITKLANERFGFMPKWKK